MKIKEMFASRKFWAMIAGVVTALGSWATGEVSASVAVPTAVGAIMAWIYGQARVDANKVIGGSK